MDPTQSQLQSAQAAVRAFDFGDYGLDDVEAGLHDRPDDQEWVPILAAEVATAVLNVAVAPDELTDAIYDVLYTAVGEHQLIHCATTEQYPPANVHGLESGDVHDIAERIARAVQAATKAVSA